MTIYNKSRQKKIMKYDKIANELGLLDECKTKIILCVLIWDGILNRYYSKHRMNLILTTELYVHFMYLLCKS